MDDIAIIGMGCLFPGAMNTEQYWRNLIDGKDCTTKLSEMELGVSPDFYYHPLKGKPDKMSYNKNGHIRDFKFDSSNYQLSVNDLYSLGALFKWTIYAADQALKDCGYEKSFLSREKNKCGLIAGNIGMPTHESKKLYSNFYNKILEPYIQELIGNEQFKYKNYWKSDELSPYNVQTGCYNAVIAAQALGLSGPCYTIDAACSSALYAIRIACHYLSNQETDMMLAGAVCNVDHVYLNCGFNVLQALPDKGESIPLDRDSDGMKTGEGAGFVVLKRYEDAIKAKDKIYGVIESFGFSNDAGKKHILVPDNDGQLLALKRAFDGCPVDLDYIECHATGTPVGDEVELNSIETHFSQNGHMPLIGANKCNVGHLMTASGMASVIKVLLSMKHGIIPGTIKINQLVETRHKKLTLDHIVQENRLWPEHQGPKRAGINAFGFGGVNGHMIVREHSDTKKVIKAKSGLLKKDRGTVPMAIIGIGIEIADTKTVEDFNRSVFECRQSIGELPHTHWAGIDKRLDILKTFGMPQAPFGAYIENLEFDCKQFKLPPNTIGIHLLSHMMLLKISVAAYLDAGYSINESARNIAVIVAGDIDFISHRYQARNEVAWQIQESLKRCNIKLSDEQVGHLEDIVKNSLFPEPYPEGITGGIGNLQASRIASVLHLNGPVFELLSYENSVAKAMELAQFMLAQEKIEAVVIASCSFNAGLEGVLWQNKQNKVNQGKNTLSYDQDSNGWTPGEGGGAVIVKRQKDAKKDKNRIYATLRSLNIVNKNTSNGIGFNPLSIGVAEACNGALIKAALTSADIDYIEVHGSGIPNEDKTEIEGLCKVYKKHDKACVIGSVKSNYGHLFAASGMISIIKTALCLFHKYFPGTPQLGRFKYPEYFERSRLQAIPESRKRKQGSKTDPYYAAVNSMGIDRSYAHIIMQEPDVEDRRQMQSTENNAKLKNDRYMTSIVVGREKTIKEFILNTTNRSLFGTHEIKKNTACNPIDYVAIYEGQRDRCVFNQYLRNTITQMNYLKAEQKFYKKAANIITPIEESHSPIFNEKQLIELTDGMVANVLGHEYSESDQYDIRTRMPSPPFMFVSRITKLTARKNKLEPCSIEWEYNILCDAWYVYNGNVPNFVAFESSHAMIVAFTFIGCDEIFKGKLRYRVIDSKTIIYSDLPKAGEVLKGKLDITSFTRYGKNYLISYVYNCYVKDRLCFRLNANSGFFSLTDIQKQKSLSPKIYFASAKKVKSGFKPFLTSRKTTFNDADLRAVQNGDLNKCFGSGYGVLDKPVLCAPDSMMIDRILDIDLHGGEWGLGVAIGEKDIDQDHWAFKAHFKNDPVMPGTLLVEGCEQMAKFFIHYMGLSSVPGLQPITLTNHQYSAIFRGEVKRERQKLCYKITCKEITADYSSTNNKLISITVIFIAELIYKKKIIGICDNLGVRYEAQQR